MVQKYRENVHDSTLAESHLELLEKVDSLCEERNKIGKMITQIKEELREVNHDDRAVRQEELYLLISQFVQLDIVLTSQLQVLIRHQ